MENTINQFTDRIIKVINKNSTNKERYVYVLLFKDSHDNGSDIEYIEQNGSYARNSIKFGSEYSKYYLIPITEEIEVYNKYFYQFFEPTERMKNYIKKIEENKK